MTRTCADIRRPTAEHRPCTARNETPLQRADRNFVELLQELRVTQTGVRILFAFLLSLAFTSRFGDLDPVQRVTYVVTLLLSVLAAALFTAPAALHRSLFQQGAKPRIVQVSSRLATPACACWCSRSAVPCCWWST